MARKQNGELQPNQELFVQIYTDPSDPKTFMNGTQAYMKAHPGANHHTAGSHAARTLAKPWVKNRIQERLEELGFGSGDRLKVVSAIGSGTLYYEKEVVTKNGEVRKIKVWPTHTERLRAVELANDMDGSKNQQEVDKEIAKEEARELRRSIMKDLMKDVTPQK